MIFLGKTLFFRSGNEPLILTEEKREMRKQQRIEELRLSSGLPPIMAFRQSSNLPELGRTTNTDLNKLFSKRHPTQEFFSFNNLLNKDNAKSGKSAEKLLIDENSKSNENSSDDDCVICMDISRNSVLRPCNHMITCYECSMLLLNREDNCPICRKRIEDVIKIFMS